MSIQMITAGAGSGKTFQICEEIINHFSKHDDWQPENLIVTTFTEKAASELKERITSKLMEAGDFRRVTGLGEACIGTVHSICLRFLKKYGYLINMSPVLDTLPEGEDMALIGELLDKHSLDNLHRLEIRLSQIDPMSRLNAYPGLIRKIAELARANGLDAQALHESAGTSIETYLGTLGPEAPFDRNTLVTLLGQQFSFFDPVSASLKSKNLEFYEAVRDILEAYRNGNEQSVAWSRYLKLLPELNREFRAQAEPLQQYVAGHHRWPAFRNDIRDYIRGIFEAAADILNDYQLRKKALGVIDFSDMEVKMLELMDNERFRSEFSSQVKLVLVDEFQDTSPLQLEIFSRWADCAEESVWVGDIKQSIYGFRGADASLVQSVIDSLPETSRRPLGTSYRSRKELVESANTLFIRAFHPMEERYIRLDPCKDIQSGNGLGASALFELSLAKDDFEENLAGSVSAIIREGWIIYDKKTREYRRIKPSDICILVREEGMNRNITNICRALSELGIPLSARGALFLEQPEVVLLISMLRYLVNRNDDHAIARILYFSDSDPDPKRLIDERIRYRTLKKNGAEGLKYGRESGFIRELDDMRGLASQTGVLQLLETLFCRTGFHSLAGRWGKPGSVKESVNRLIGLAATYSDTCTRLSRIESIYGFIRFAEEATSGRSRDELSGDGVNVMTYHSAKGLEWPVVFLASMGNAARGNVFSPAVITEPGARLFEGRRIRFWPWPYNSRVTTSHLNTLFEAANEEVKAVNREEEKRLMYVGFTRARDYLFLASAENNYNWMEETCSNEWRSGLNITPLEFAAGTEDAPSPTVRVARKMTPAAVTPAGKYFLAPSADPMDTEATLHEPARMGSYRPLQSKPDEAEEAELGNLFHQFFATGRNAQKLIDGFGLGHLITDDYLTESLKSMKDWAEKNYPGAVWHAEWPVTLYTDGHMVQGIADLVLELPDRLILIDHKSYPGASDTLHKHINEKSYPGQLAWYKKALEETTGKKVSAVYLHFPVSSAMVEIEYQ